MKQRLLSLLTLTGFFLLLCLPAASAADKQVMASGGASASLLANNLPSLAMAAVMQPDSIKMDLLLSRDMQFIIFSSPDLQLHTNVAELFPDRAREDSSYPVIDFSLAEIKQLTLQDPTEHFPAATSLHLTIPSLEEGLTMIRGLEQTLEKSIAIAIEPKQTWRYRQEGIDISRLLLTVLKRYNYTGVNEETTLLSYSVEELKHIAQRLMPQLQMRLKLIQLIDSNEGEENMAKEWGEFTGYNYDWMFSKSGLRSISRYAAGIGLHKSMLTDSSGTLLLSHFFEDTHQLGMDIYTFSGDDNSHSLLPFVNSFTEELEFLYFTAGVDTIITGYCRDTLYFLKNRTEKLV